MKTDLWSFFPILAVALIILFPLFRLLVKPLKLLSKLLINGLLGFIMIWVINIIAGSVGFFLPLNLVTIIVAGFLGIPGIALLAIIKYCMII